MPLSSITRRQPLRRRARFVRELPFHMMMLPAVVLVFIFSYIPMFGIVMAFQKFNVLLSFWKSKFIGWGNFEYLFSMPEFSRAMWNTVIIAVLKIITNLTVTLSLSLLINECTRSWFKRGVQVGIFLPFFLSWSILGGIVLEIFSLSGPINKIIGALSGNNVFFLASNKWFRFVLVSTDVWKGMGYNIIIFLAAITNVDPGLYESASIDGCGRPRQTWHITLPGMQPIIVLISTLSIGSLLTAGFEQILILYNPLVYETVDIIDTLVYRLGLVNGQLAPAAAAGLYKSIISLAMVGIAYYTAYRVSDYRIF
ncbi:sugar ABC transporter permease [Clostridia bacterium]|nr:sugar ABC transporter permease [Clostridia bacterium]